MMYICIDVDGTIVEHEFPLLGKPVPMALEVMKELQDAGHKLILHTMRSDRTEYNDGAYLTQAVNYCKENGIELFGANTNPTQKEWTSSPKTYGHIYIDDAALGCPLIHPNGNARPYVDWRSVRKLLISGGILTEDK